jgi:hypothetical protein
LKKTNFPQKKFTGRDGQIEEGREDVDAHQGTDTLAVFVRKSSRESGDTYPTIGAVLTVMSMCISSIRPTTTCSVVKDSSTVTATNTSLTPTVSRVSGGYTRHLHALS